MARKYLTERQIVKAIYNSELKIIDSVIHCGLNQISFYNQYCGNGGVRQEFTLYETNRFTIERLNEKISALANEA